MIHPSLQQLLFLTVLLTGFLHATGQETTSPESRSQLHSASAIMFKKIVEHDAAWIQDNVTADFFSINGDGTTESKKEMLADTARGKFLSAFTFKMFDEQIRAYGSTGIVTGRVQALMNNQLAVEFLYTAIFVRQKGKWLYAGWQGTLSKDSPPPPPMPAKQ